MLSVLIGYSISWPKESENNQSKQISFFEYSTIGICYSLIVSGVIFNLDFVRPNQKPTAIFVILISVILGLFLRIAKRRDSRVVSIGLVKRIPLAFVVALVFLTIYSGGFASDPDLRIRNGPDLVGWMASAQYFEKHDSLRELESWLTIEFPNHPQQNAFAKSSWGTDDSIFATASYTKQVQAEVLIGAKRLAIPAFLALIKIFLPQQFNIFEIYLALSSILMLSLLLWAFERVRRRNSGKIRITITLTMITLLCSYQLFLPILEGGFGQNFSYLMFAYLVNTNYVRGNLKYGMVIVIGAAYFAYRDLLLYSPPLLLAYYLILRQNLLAHLILNLRNLIGKLIILGITIFFALGPFLVERMRSLAFGGWEEGFMPSILDIVGLSGIYSWSLRGSENIFFSIFSLALTFAVMTIPLWKFSDKRVLLAGLTILGYYLILWTVSTINQNNYPMWKSLPYFTLFAASVLSVDWSLSKKASKYVFKLMKWVVPLQATLALIFYFQSANLTETKRIFSLESTAREAVKTIVDEYAIEFRGVNPQQSYALLGDMEWATKHRQIEIQSPKLTSRPIVYSIPVEVCNRAEDPQLILFVNKHYCFVQSEKD